MMCRPVCGTVRQGTPHECISAYLGGAAGVRPPTSGDAATRIESLELTRSTLRSGESLGVRLHCAVRPDGWTEPEVVSVRVRSAQSGEVLFSTGSRQLGVTLPGAGEYSLSLDIQMNVARGVYLVESFVWDHLMSRESFVGPSAHVDVRGAEEFDGLVQMHPRLRLVAEGAPSERAT